MSSTFKNMKIDIDNESLHIYIEDNEGENIQSIVYWHIDEVAEDENVAISMVNAVHLFYTNQELLLNKLGHQVIGCSVNTNKEIQWN